MDEIININLYGYETDNHQISISKTRIWAEMLTSINWLLSIQVSGRTKVQNGLGLLIINNLAIIIEGFISDILEEHFAKEDLSEPKEIKKMGSWDKKRILYNKTFEKQLEQYSNYKSIECLFFLRNNISHGKAHSEIIKTDIITNERSRIESVDKNYQKVRAYLIEKNIILDPINFTNVGILWKLDITRFFLSETNKFITEISESNTSLKIEGIRNELQSCL